MRKLPLRAITTMAALAMTGTMSMSAQASMKSFIIGGNSQLFGSSNGCNITAHHSCNNNSCNGIPGVNIPGINLPSGNRSTFPGMNAPMFSQDQPNLSDIGVSTPTSQDNTNTSFAQQVADLVNMEREKAGLAPLKLDRTASNAAQVRAKEIQTSFSHTRPDGSSFSTALTQNGIGFKGAGENIAYGQSSPQEVMKGWMNSQGHRANILNKDFTSIGVGHYENSAGVDYWAQLFTS